MEREGVGEARRREARSDTTTQSGPQGDKFDIHFQALCSAVEQEKLEKARSILENQTHVNVNGVNGDGFTLLDLAFMTGNQALLSLVVHHGGKEGAFFPSPEAVSAHLLSLTTESRKQVEKFNQLVKLTASGAAPSGSLSQVQLKECEKQLTLWQKRLTTMKKLKAGFDVAGCPHAPIEVVASVTGSSCINVRVKEPEKAGNSLFTKFKIQWSLQDTFSEIEGEIEVKTIHTLEYNIENLTEGTRYFIRASFGNPKGYGPFSASKPKSLVPSSWRNVDHRTARISDQPEVVTALLDSLLRNRSHDLADYSVEEDQDYEDGRIRKKGLLQLFQTAPKFAKTPRLGVFLTSVMFHEDKVLVTNEDFLPLLEVQEDVPSTLNADFHWFMKMCFMWQDLARLRADLAKVTTSSLRARLLTAAAAMQSALGTENLGMLYFKPLRHHSGAVVLSLVHHVKSPKNMVSLSLKWAPLSKAQWPFQVSEEEGGSGEGVRDSLRQQILFHQVSSVSVSRGLHLCYLQSHTTIESMSVVVSNTGPSVLPYIKIRENPHVTMEEWQWVRHMGRLMEDHMAEGGTTINTTPTTNFLVGEGEEGFDVRRHLLQPTEAQYTFGKLLQQAAVRLFHYLEIEDVEQRDNHRFYDTEIIELGPDISLVLILPPIHSVCSVNETSMAINLNRQDLLLVPLQAWEVLHLSTYHRKLLTVYARLSSILEVDLSLARQIQREALSPAEVEAAGQTLAVLQEHQEALEEAWKGVRWIRDVLSYARLKKSVGINLGLMTDWYSNQPNTPDDSQFSNAESMNLQIKSANVFRLDTLKNWNTRKRDSASSDSGALVGGKPGLSRTPTTRSDPLEFNVINKENDGTNLAQVRTRLLQDGTPLPPPPDPPSSYSSLNYSVSSTNSIDSNDNEYEPKSGSRASELINNQRVSGSVSPEPNILQVFAAYDTGLAQGTSVRIAVTTSTSAREVVDLVIKQLNMAVILKGKDGPLYENEKLRNFCLVAVIGSRERCLRDDFKPLNLQNPWKKGRLFVRMKHDLLAAIEHISRHTTML